MVDKQELRKSLLEAGAIDVFGREVRMSRSPVTVLREDGDEGESEPRLEGYAAKFNTETVIGGWFQFREKISEGAFTKTIQEHDVRHLFNHDPSQVLGRNKAGTLRLSEDNIGLMYDVDLNMNDPDAVRVHEKVKRGDVDQSSFAFVVTKETWEEPDDPDGGELPLRTINEAKLYDTSTVTYPAYEDTTAMIMSSANARALETLKIGADVRTQIANENLTPDLAAALRETAQRAEELAARCEEGQPCEQAGEEPLVTETERAGEEPLGESINVIELLGATREQVDKLIAMINAQFKREEEHPDDPEVEASAEEEEEDDTHNDRAHMIELMDRDQQFKLDMAKHGILLQRSNS